MNKIEGSDSPVYSFAPIADLRSKLLILGTIPGKASLRMNAYYAHPQNAFWKIIFNLHNLPFSTDIQFRKEVLLQNGIALWDVLRKCERRSSLDTDIRREEPNDLRALLSSHPGITEIFFNGKEAARYFNKYFADNVLHNRVLPSTSPAHAIKWEMKLAAWHEILLPSEADKHQEVI